ncbi:type II toxin-antitoxin system RelE/ParE family toxin [Pseudomonas sp. SWRI18]|uniref:type II toxin-antitoxin system RelE/ParE family toxin n=1 Tax=Pseudomonas sp. SWRI18 TaxID=2753888 RepID=UPI0016451F56|nr:type II toxin-antitoxin system RelE/ParE family toxin [Pseudomonas sp. SWRI18]
MPKIALSSKAESDLDGIYEHYEGSVGAELGEAAVFHILNCLEMLERFPNAGRASPVPDCRELIITTYPYRATYSLQGDRVMVFRILHQHSERREDW